MDLHGWDSVFVVDIDVINKSLAESASRLVAEFDFSEQGYEVRGEFGAWSIAPTGGGKLLRLQLPIVSGSFSGGGSTADLSGLQVLLQVHLDLLPAPDGSDGKTLRFSFKSVGGGGNPTIGDGVVTPVGVNDPTGKITPLQKAVIGQAVAQCMVSSTGRISFVFATVNPLAAESVPWLKPVQSDYCYGAMTGKTNPVLAILSVNDTRDVSGLERKVDPAIIANGCNAGLAISSELFLKQMLAAGFASSFGVGAETFSLANTKTLTSTSFPLKRVSAAGEHYYPKVTSFSAVLEDTQVVVSLHGACDMGIGISMTFSACSHIGAEWDRESGGMAFRAIGAPSFSHDTHVPWYDYVAGACLFGLPDLIMEICVESIGSSLGHAVKSLVASGVIASTVPGMVSWGGSSGFEPSAGGLAGALYLQGDTPQRDTWWLNIAGRTVQDGTFGQWFVTEDRSSQLPLVCIPMLGGTFSWMPGQGQIDIEPCNALVRVEILRTGEQGTPDTVRSAKVVSMEPHQHGTLRHLMLQSLLEFWLNRHLRAFDGIIEQAA